MSKISVIIPTWNNLRYLVECLESFRSDWEKSSEYEVIVVNNGSTDGTEGFLENLAERYSSLEPIHSGENLGWVKGINRGLEHADGDYVVFLNDDTLVPEGALARMRDIFEEDHPILYPVGAVGPCSNAVGGPQRIVADTGEITPANYLKHAEAIQEQFNGVRDLTFFLSGFCMMLRMSALDTVGHLDELFSPGGFDDNDIVLRLQDAGYKAVIARDTFVYHHSGRTIARFPELRHGVANRSKFLEKWRDRRGLDRPKKLVAFYRVKDCEDTIKKSLDATAGFADEIVVLDDASTDRTGEICENHPAVVAYRRLDGSEPFNERRDRNRAMEMAFGRNPDWAISIDGDEVFEMTRGDAEALMSPEDPHVKAYDFSFYTFWDDDCEYHRTDGVFGRMHGPRMFKVEPNQEIVLGNKQGLHCGNIPAFPPANIVEVPFRVLHYGYYRRELRERKYEFYENIDTDKQFLLIGAGNYSHLVAKNVSLAKFPSSATLGILVVMKNEEAELEEFFLRIQNRANQIVVVDTGSTDRSVEIAKRFTDDVYQIRGWSGDLSEARNVALDRMKTDWVLQLDVDEWIEPVHWVGVYRTINTGDSDAYLVQIANHHVDHEPTLQENVRLFNLQKNKGKIRYNRPVHETVADSIQEHNLVLTNPPYAIAIQHAGYLKPPEVIQAKLDRYMEINDKSLRKNPNDAQLWFNRGLQRINDGEELEGIMDLEKAVELQPAFYQAVTSLAHAYHRRLIKTWEIGTKTQHDATVQEALSALSTLKPLERPFLYVGIPKWRRNDTRSKRG